MKKYLCLALLPLALAAAPPAARKPNLVLAIMVDQFRYDYLTRFRAEYNAGLARLLEKGAVFTNANYEHFPTVTAIGHSTLLTGATPSISGIVGNTWYERETRKQVTSVSDDTVQVLGGTGKIAASPRRLLVSSIGDEIKMSGKGENRVIGMSIKDRSAILPVGRMADGAYWFDEASGNFVSSTYYFPDLPAWVKEFNRSRVVDKYVGGEWAPFRKMAAAPDKEYYRSMERTPFGSEILEAFAEQAIRNEKLGRHAGVDLLCVSFSSNDYIGHDFGPDSPQVHDISVRTDKILEKLFRFADSEVGLDNVLVVMTADHGVAPIAEVMQKRKMPGGRTPEKFVLDQIQKKLEAVYGPGKWVVGNSGPAPYLNYDLIAQKQLRPADVQQTAAEAARAVPHIFRVYTREQLLTGRVLQDRIDRKVQNGFHGERASDLFIVGEPYWVFEEKGASHGSPFSYDSHVPIVFMGPGIRPGRYHRSILVNDIAPTLATLLEVEIPSGSIGRVLDEMFEN